MVGAQVEHEAAVTSRPTPRPAVAGQPRAARDRAPGATRALAMLDGRIEVGGDRQIHAAEQPEQAARQAEATEEPAQRPARGPQRRRSARRIRAHRTAERFVHELATAQGRRGSPTNRAAGSAGKREPTDRRRPATQTTTRRRSAAPGRTETHQPTFAAQQQEANHGGEQHRGAQGPEPGGVARTTAPPPRQTATTIGKPTTALSASHWREPCRRP